MDGISDHLCQPWTGGWRRGRAAIDTPIPKFERHHARVLSNDSVAERIHVMRLHAPDLSPQVRPAQFVNVQTDPGLSPFLRRPLSILNADSEGGWIEIYYDVIGPGTGRLGVMVPGDLLDLLGPLGLPYEPSPGRTLLVGGGVGVVPLAFLSWYHPSRRSSMTLLMGAANARRTPDMKRIVPSDLETLLATDDGSIGYHGFVTDLITNHIDDDTVILTCGPHGMMARVAEIAKTAGVSCYASLENHMACGFGACVGCVVEYKEYERDDRRYRRICIEGPVVDARQIVW